MTRVPAWSVPLFFVVGAVSQYVGAAVGVFLFETTDPAAVAWLRAAAAAVALLAWRRPWRARLDPPLDRGGGRASASSRSR